MSAWRLNHTGSETILQPFDPLSVLLIAALNPAVIAVAIFMGRSADQPQKLIVAAFAAALTGAVLIWIVTFAGLLPAKGMGGEAGVFVASFVLGVVWASLGYMTRKKAHGGK